MKSVAAPLALILAMLQTLVAAQFANHLPPLLSGPIREPNQTLIAIFGAPGSNSTTVRSPVAIRSPGQLVQKQEVAQAPLLGIPVAPANGSSYAVLMVDPNYNNSVPTSTVLHFLCSDVSVTNASIIYAGLRGSAITRGRELASYLPPQAPSPNMPHNYTLMLFRQPNNFSVPSKYDDFLNGSDNRRNFPVLDFLTDSGLGKSPVAAVYFGEGGPGNMTSPTSNSTSNGTGSAKPTGGSSGPRLNATYTTSAPTPTGYPSGSASGSAQPTQTGSSANGATSFHVSPGSTALFSFIGLLGGALVAL